MVKSAKSVVRSTIPLADALTVSISVVELTIPLASAFIILVIATTLVAGAKFRWKYSCDCDTFFFSEHIQCVV